MTRGVTFPFWFNRSHSQGESNWSSAVRGGSGSLLTGMCQLRRHGHLPSTSARIRSCAAAVADLQYSLKGVQSGEQK